MKIKRYFSPNFNPEKRSKSSIKIIVIHYTGMQSEIESLYKLSDFKSKVSCHYFINRKGLIYRLIDDKFIAWHAGQSCWGFFNNINKHSLGIELVNKGHQFGYNKFTKKQIHKLSILCKTLIKKYKISKTNVVGHSDIAPTRKVDPGEKFPWNDLYKKKIGIWHNLDSKTLRILRRKEINEKKEKIEFIKNLKKIGYCVHQGNDKIVLKLVVKSFQRRFRKEVINGSIDRECAAIASNLAKKL
jgi:N-acetylmuramoyl-L-alanine amidase